MRVVVTGGAGFIGANVCRALAASPGVDDVVAIDDLSTGVASNLRDVDCEFVEGSILDATLLNKCTRNAHAIVHLAARPSVPRSLQDPMASHVVNATGTMQVLESARLNGSPHVVLASSSSVYGANPTLPKHEELAVAPLSPYAASKLATESYALSYQHSFGLPVLAFRFFNVFGPLQPAGHAYAAVVPAFIEAALAGRPLPLNGDGRQSRDFTFVDTVSRVIVAAVTSGVTNERPVNLAYGTRTDLLTVAATLSALLGTELRLEHRPERMGDVRHSQAANAKLVELFPEIVPVPLAEGLKQTIGWFRGRGMSG